MPQILDALPAERPNVILCSYRNPSPGLRIARISNISQWYFERVIFPGESLLFEAVTGAILEIYSGNDIMTLLVDRIPCNRLQIATPNSSTVLRTMT